MKKENFLEWNNRILAKTFSRIGLNILWMVFIDLIFYLSSGFVVMFWLRRMQQKLLSISIPSQDELVSIGYARAQEVLASTKSYYFLVLFSFVLVAILVIFLASIAKGIIWSITSKTKLNIHLLSRFLALNLIWITIWIAAILSIAFFADAAYVYTFFTAATILGIYFSAILYSLFMKEQKLRTIGKAISLGAKRLRHFSIPFASFLAVIYLLLYLNIKAVFPLSSYIYTLLFIAAFALLRLYFFEIVGDLGKSFK